MTWRELSTLYAFGLEEADDDTQTARFRRHGVTITARLTDEGLDVTPAEARRELLAALPRLIPASAR
jgi:hypothetical protein